MMAGMTGMPGMTDGDALSSWSAGYLGATLLMWSVMMAAMMLPSALPMIRLYALSSRRALARGSTVPVLLFVAGYLLVWAAFSAAVTALQALFHSQALLASGMGFVHPWLSGSVLLLAGTYQFTRWKSSCLAYCQSPLEFVMRHWQSGRSGAIRMGLKHGSYCLGCCWSLMLVLFVVGVMNLLWVAVLAFVVLVEKNVAQGPWFSRTTGLVLASAAVLQFVS